MSTPDFNEDNIRRDTAGRFATKGHAEADGGLTALTERKQVVFRSGQVQAPVERGCEADVFAAIDALAPAGHPSRTTGIFAAPRIDGVVRWVRGNYLGGSPDLKVRGISVNADAVRVYRIKDYERASDAYDFMPREFKKRTAEYFANSMTLTEWLAADLDPSEWEVIIPPEEVKGARPVAASRVADAAPDEYMRREVRKMLKGRQ